MNTDKFDLNLLRAFDTLMKERNVSNAANRMCLSQPAMSNILRRLRECIDDPILVRTSTGMQPTPRALSLEKPIRAALYEIEQALKSNLDFDPSTSSRTFHIATTDYVELAYLPDLVVHIGKIAPNLKIQVHTLSPDVPLRQLEDGFFDFAIGRYLDIPNALDASLWKSEELVCLVRNDHPLIDREISLDLFLEVPQIWVNGGQRTGVVDKWLKQNNLTRNVKHVTPSFLIAPNLVARTDMLVVTPLAIAKYFSSRMPLKIIPLPMELDLFYLHILRHPFHASTPEHNWFIRQLNVI